MPTFLKTDILLAEAVSPPHNRKRVDGIFDINSFFVNIFLFLLKLSFLYAIMFMILWISVEIYMGFEKAERSDRAWNSW